ncbi:hypothetical protein DER44DRAFT_801871 [Fusarium oxysporum]|nr:hypothetical protein DER44DRAFT_801871 [Fusarium oxysporum]
MADDAVLLRFKLFIDPQARVLICCHDTCRFALSSNLAQVSEHLRNKHKITGTERRQVTDLLRARIPKLRNRDAPV